MLDTNLYTKYPNLGAFPVDYRKFNRDRIRIPDILFDNYEWIQSLYEKKMVRDVVMENIQKSILCNSIYLGFDRFVCPRCGNESILFHKCHSKFCNPCGVRTQKHLAAVAESICVDVTHRHFVFTIPEAYRIWFRRDRSALNILFVSARNSVCKLFNESAYRKMKRKQKAGKVRPNRKDNTYFLKNSKNLKIFGMISTLHTFGRDLKWNPHIHAIVPEICYDSRTGECRKMEYFNFASLRKTWQYEVTRLMTLHFGKAFRKEAQKSYRKQADGFYVYAKKQEEAENSHGRHVGGAVNYMMRYAARPAMAESRISSYDRLSNMVEWSYNDHKTEERVNVRENAHSLIEKLMIHIADKHFRMVRYYGFYNSKMSSVLDQVHLHLASLGKVGLTAPERKNARKKSEEKLHFRTLLLDTFNRDILLCRCGKAMIYSDSAQPEMRGLNEKEYRNSCLHEMLCLRLRGNGPLKRPPAS